MKQNQWLKIFFALMLSTVLMLCAVSCGDNNQSDESTQESTQDATQQDEETVTGDQPDESLGGFSKNY